MELILRKAGHLKSITDNNTLWGMEMDKIRKTKVDVALVGASRMQLGLQVDHFQEITGLSAANVTIDGSSPTPVLEYIANETDFSGLVLVSVTAYHILNNDLHKSSQQVQRYNETFFGAKKYNPILNKKILNFLQDRLVLFSANSGFGIVRRINNPIYISTQKNRSRRGHYREILTDEGIERARKKRLATVPRRPTYWDDDILEQQWSRNVSKISMYVKKIHDRGGKVLFVRFPTSGEYGDILEAEYPRNIYWDSLSRRLGSATVHFKDFPQTAGLECPEGSHLNYDDALTMTDVLAKHVLNSVDK